MGGGWRPFLPKERYNQPLREAHQYLIMVNEYGSGLSSPMHRTKESADNCENRNRTDCVLFREVLKK